MGRHVYKRRQRHHGSFPLVVHTHRAEAYNDRPCFCVEVNSWVLQQVPVRIAQVVVAVHLLFVMLPFVDHQSVVRPLRLPPKFARSELSSRPCGLRSGMVLHSGPARKWLLVSPVLKSCLGSSRAARPSVCWLQVCWRPCPSCHSGTRGTIASH